MGAPKSRTVELAEEQVRIAGEVLARFVAGDLSMLGYLMSSGLFMDDLKFLRGLAKAANAYADAKEQLIAATRIADWNAQHAAPTPPTDGNGGGR